jgi:predicted acetyltransferase
MRKYRRGGVASAAVRAIVTRYPGVWEAAIMQRNTPAQAFWPRAVAATPGVRDIETLQGDGVEWIGPIVRFRVDA